MISTPVFRASALFACLAGATSCGGAQGDAATQSGAQQADWAMQFLGTRPERTAVVRFPPNAMQDPVWKDAIDFRPGQRSARDLWMPLDFPDIAATAQCAQTDYYYVQATAGGPQGTGIVVLHSVLPGLDPGAYGFMLLGRAASGTGAYRSSAAKDPSLELFVLPASRTWVFANGVAAVRLAAAFITKASEPPPLPALPGSFIDATGPIAEVGTQLSRAHDLGWIKNFDHVTGAGIVMYPPTPTKELPLAAKLVYSNAKDAHDAAEDLRHLIANGSLRSLMHDADDSLAVEDIGATLLMRAISSQKQQVPSPPKPPPRMAPELTLPSINGNGDVSMAAMRGRIVVVHFWGTWCAECKRTMPALQRLAERYNGSLEVVGVAEEGDPSAVLRFAREHGITFSLVMDPKLDMYHRWAPEVTPATFIIDRTGAIRAVEGYMHQDKSVDEKAVEDTVHSLI